MREVDDCWLIKVGPPKKVPGKGTPVFGLLKVTALYARFDEAVELAAPANSWKTLTVANGCQFTLPDSKLVPTRRLRRPISLSMSEVAIEAAGTIPSGGGGGATPPLEAVHLCVDA